MKEPPPIRWLIGASGVNLLLLTGPFRVPVEGIVAICLLGAVAVVAASAERRRRQASEDRAAADASEPPEPPLDEDTIGTIEYAPPSEAVGHQDADAGGGEPA